MAGITQVMLSGMRALSRKDKRKLKKGKEIEGVESFPSEQYADRPSDDDDVRSVPSPFDSRRMTRIEMRPIPPLSTSKDPFEGVDEDNLEVIDFENM